MSTPDIASASESARQELLACEKEIGGIKNILRSIGPLGDDDDETNTLTVHWTKIQDLPEAATPRLSLQLSSPVEEISIESLADGDSSDPNKGIATFRGVETGQAMLTCSVFDQDVPLGLSESCDLAPICKFDAMEFTDEYETIQEIPIKPNGTDGSVDADSKTASATCTVTLKFVFAPSKKDRREELYDMLNQCSHRKAAAVEKYRQSAVADSRQQLMSANGEGGGDSSNSDGQVVTKSSSQKAAVRAGFLNRKPKKPEPSRLYQLYEKYLGPQSLVRATIPIAQNYIIFGGFCLFMHFKGQLLALPAPV